MNFDTLQTLIRSVLKIGGGALIANGYGNDTQIEELIGGILALIGIIWGVLHRKPAAPTDGPNAHVGVLFLICIPLLMMLPACGTPKLELGGAYAPAATNITASTEGVLVTNVVSTVAPDIAFFTVDSAFLLAHSAIDAVFTIEKNNRQLLWQVSPEIKHTIDAIRPKAVEIVKQYAIARAVYRAHPTPAGLSTLEEILARANQVSTALQAVIPAQK